MFCEKPIDLDLGKARAAAGRVRRRAASCSASTAASTRTSRRCKRKLASGAIGELETLHLVNHDPAAPPPAFIPRSRRPVQGFHHPRSRPGLLRCWASRRARSSRLRQLPGRSGDRRSWAMSTPRRVILRTESGKLCVITNTRRSGYGYDQRIEAYGSRGMAATGNERLDAVEVWSEAGALRLADPAQLPRPLRAPPTRAKWTISPTCWPDAPSRRSATPRASPRWPGRGVRGIGAHQRGREALRTTMHKIALIGAGRIGRIHAANVAAHPDLAARLRGRSDRGRRANRSPQATARRSASSTARSATRASAGVIVASSTDTHLDFSAARGASRQGGLLRKADRSRSRARRSRRAEVRSGAARLFLAFNRRFDPNFRGAEAQARRRRGRRAGDAAHHQPRPVPAAGRLRPGERRAVQGHGDPRFRHGALAARRRAERGVRRRRLPGRSGDRPAGRHRHRQDHPAHAVGQALRDLQQPPQRLRLRPAHRSVRRARRAARRQRRGEHGRDLDRGRRAGRSRSRTSSSTATPRPTGARWRTSPTCSRAAPTPQIGYADGVAALALADGRASIR